MTFFLFSSASSTDASRVPDNCPANPNSMESRRRWWKSCTRFSTPLETRRRRRLGRTRAGQTSNIYSTRRKMAALLTFVKSFLDTSSSYFFSNRIFDAVRGIKSTWRVIMSSVRVDLVMRLQLGPKETRHWFLLYFRLRWVPIRLTSQSSWTVGKKEDVPYSPLASISKSMAKVIGPQVEYQWQSTEMIFINRLIQSYFWSSFGWHSESSSHLHRRCSSFNCLPIESSG